MKTKPKRKHGKSRLEKLLEASIRQELQIKAQWREIGIMIIRLQQLERTDALRQSPR
jgi:hypothetical protein